MKCKTMFRREAAFKNVQASAIPPLPYLEETRVVELSDVVDQYSQLKRKPGWKIESFHGEVYALFHGKRVPHDELMEGIIGDESPLSYLQAAVCYHHLMEYSNLRKTNVISQAIMDDVYIAQLGLLGNWNFGKWKRSFNPIFFYDSLHHPAVIFFTYHQEGRQVIQKHVHRFSRGSYKLKLLKRTWATVS